MSEHDNLPAKQESPAEKQRARMDALLTAVDARSSQLVTLLQHSGVDFDRFREVFRRALIKGQEKAETNLLLADAGSVIQACIDACTVGLLPDGRQGAIVLFNQNVAPRGQPKKFVKRAQFIAQYEGMLHIAYASGNFTSIMAHLVYEGDEWDYALGIDPYIKHKPKPRPPRGDGAPEYQIIAAYAVAKTTNGGTFIEVFEPEDIRKVRAVAKAQTGPWAGWADQMARKGPLRRMWKFLPRDRRMEQVLEVDSEAFEGIELEAEAPKERRLTAGFAKPAALSQGADMTVDTSMPPVVDGEPLTHGEDASNLVPEINMAPAPEDQPPPEPEAPLKRPEVAALEKQLIASTSWLNVKQALKTFRKSDFGQIDAADRSACVQVWNRMCELRAGGQDKTDFIADPMLFECWVVGAEPAPDRDAVMANWAIVQNDSAFKKLAEEERERIAARVTESMGDGAE